MSKRNQTLLSITRLVIIFRTFDSEDDTVRSFPEPLAESALPFVS